MGNGRDLPFSSFCSPGICNYPAAMAEDEAKVKVSRVSTVPPAIPTVKRRMFLSRMDISAMPYNNMRTLLFYKTVLMPQKEFSVIVEKLKMSLSLVLVDFYPLAGRLDTKELESYRPEIDCNDGGVEFVEASIEMAFEDVETDGFQHQKFFSELVRTRHENDTSLLSIQVTAFLGGGFCMGANFHHVIADGISFWHFMKCWAERSRGLPISKNPQHMRTVFKRDKVNSLIPIISFRAQEVVTDRISEAQIFRFIPKDLLPVKYSEIKVTTSGASESENSYIQQAVKEETKLEASTFEFNEKMIQNLKERSGASTSFVSVAAQFWRCVMKARQVPEKEAVYFVCPADCRGRIKPSLPPTYFGNCVSLCIAGTTAKNLLERDICFAAELIEEGINSCTTQEQMNYYIDWVESYLDSDREGAGAVRNLLGGYAVLVGMSPKFPVYEIDHGWGRPLNLQNILNQIGGMLVFPGRGGEKSIAVSTCLPHHQMETLKRLLFIISD